MALIDSKSPLASKGVWGGVLALIAGVVGAVSGMAISETDIQQTVELGANIVAAVSGLLAIYGRVFATKKIG